MKKIVSTTWLVLLLLLVNATNLLKQKTVLI